MREHTDGEFPFANDFNAVVRDALAGSTLVESGCTVSDGGTADLSLDVASGQAVVNGTDASVSSQTVTLASADPDNPRYDLVVADSSGTASVVAGTASATPKAPSIPSDSVLLAVVEVPAGASGVTDADIYDARAVLSGIPNDVVTQGTGSGLDADTVDGYGTPLPPGALQTGSGSGLDADTVDGQEASDLGGVQIDSSGSPYLTSTTAYPSSTVPATPDTTTTSTVKDNFGPDTLVVATKVNPSTTYTQFTNEAVFDGTATSFTGWNFKAIISVDGSRIAQNGGNATTTAFGPSYASTATTGTATPDQIVTFKGRVECNGNATHIGGDIDLARAVANSTGSTQLNQGVGTTHSPVWVKWSSSTGNGNWSLNRSAGGEILPTNDFLLSSLTTGDSLVVDVSWSNVSSTTKFRNTWELAEGQFM